MSTSDNTPQVMPKSSLGLDENIAALLAYVLGIITGVIFIVLEKESRFVKFHAIQSILLSVVAIVLSIIFRIIPGVGGILSALLSLACLVITVFLIFKAFKHEWFKLPFIGDIAEKKAG